MSTPVVEETPRIEEESTSAIVPVMAPLHKLKFPSNSSPARIKTDGDQILWTPPKLKRTDSSIMKHSPRDSPVKINNQVSTVEDLVHVVNTLYQEQQRVNMVNMKLNAVNLFANFANVVNVNRLSLKCNEFERELQDEKRVVSELSGTVEEQKSTIDGLSTTVDTLRTEVVEQKEELHKSTTKYYTSISELESTMNIHRQIINKLESSKLKEDFAVDAFMLLTSIYCVNTRFVHFPLRFVLSVVLLPPGTKFIARLFSKMVIALFMTYYVRRLAIREGFHASVGSLTQYVMKGASYLFFSSLSRR